MPIYKGVDLNAALTPPNWGPKELAALQLVIDGQVGDTVNAAVESTGHLHAKMYNGYRAVVVDADNTSNRVTLGEVGASWAQTIIEGGSSHPNAIVLRTPGNDHVTVNPDDGILTLNTAAVLQQKFALRDSHAHSLYLAAGVTNFLECNTTDDLIEIGQYVNGTRPVETRALGKLRAGHSLNLLGDVGSSTIESEILTNAYHDGTDYRRIDGGSATRMYSSGGTVYFFRCAGDAADSVITWGQPVLTISDGSIGFGTGSPGVSISNWGRVYHYGLPTGTDQSAAGASAGELWADSDDGYTVKLGV